MDIMSNSINKIKKQNPQGVVGVTQNSSAYQANLQQPVQQAKWYAGDKPTPREMLGKIYDIYQQDNAYGQKMLDNFHLEQQNPASDFYAPYSIATNKSVSNLNSLGVDTSNIDDNWFNQTKWLNDYLIYDGTTLSPSKPGKNATAQQMAAYERYQIEKANGDTKAVDSEWAALQQELAWMATKDPRHLSDDAIVDSIDWKKYPTLKKLTDSLTPGSGVNMVELNHGTDFSTDNLYGAIWAARNNGGAGSAEANTMLAALGKGNVWQSDPETQAKLTIVDAKYSPHSVGSTLYDQMLYFDTDGFNQQWLDENKWMLESGDKTQRDNYIKVAEAESKTQKAEEELTALRTQVQKWLDKGWSEETINKRLNDLLADSDYSTLAAMDNGMKYGGDKLVGMTRSVNYRKADILNWIHTETAENEEKTTAVDLASWMGGVTGAVDNWFSNSFGWIFGAGPKGDAAGTPTANSVNDAINNNVQGKTEPAKSPATPGVNAEGKTESAGAAVGSTGSELPTGSNVVRPNDGISAQAALAMDKTAKEAAASMDPIMTPAERTAAASFSTMAKTAAENVRVIRKNSSKVAPALVAENTNRVVASFSQEVLDMYPTLVDYEQQQDNLYYLQMEKEMLEGKLGNLVNATAYSFETTIDGYTYQVSVDEDGNPRTIKVDNNGKWLDVTNSPLVTTTLVDQINASEEAQAFKDSRNAARDELEHNPNIDYRVANEQLDRLAAVDAEIEEAQGYLDENKAAYDENVAKYDAAVERRNVQMQALKDGGYDTTELETADVMLSYLTQFTQYDPTKWGEAYAPAYAYSERMIAGDDSKKVYADAQAEYEEVLEQIEDVKAARQWAEAHGVKLSNDINSNIDRRIAKLERDSKSLEFFLTPSRTGEEQYKEGVAAGRKIVAENDAALKERIKNVGGIPFEMSSLLSAFTNPDQLTKEEKDLYCYYLATDPEKAQQYADFMSDETYGILTYRAAMKAIEAGEDITKSGLFGALIANVAAVALSPINTITDIADFVKTKVTGKETNPYSALRTGNLFKNAVRETSESEIENQMDKWFGKDNTASNVAKTIGKGAYQILTMRADSAMNYATFGAAFGWSQATGALKFAEEFVTASAMGISAASDAAANAKERGASDTQAMLIAGATYLAETGTELIPLDNMMEAFKGGESLTADGVKQFLVKWLTESGLEESIGESLSDIISNFADEKVMGELSNHNQRVAQIKAENRWMSDEQAEAQARREELADIMYTAVISYLSPGADLAQYALGRSKGYRSITRELNKNGYNYSVRDVRKGIKLENKLAKAAEEQAVNKPLGTFNIEKPGVTPEMAAQAKAEAKAKADSYIVDFEIMETAKSGTWDAMDACVAAVLENDVSDVSKDTAAAAAANLFDLLGVEGNTPAEEVQDVIMGAMAAKVDPALAKQGIVFAALGGEESASRRLMQSEVYKTSTLEGKASALAVAAQKDMINGAVTQAVSDAVHEHRVGVAEGELMAEGAAEAALKADVRLEAAKEETQKAEASLETQQNVEQAKADATVEAAEAMANDPSDVNSKNLTSAISDQAKAAEVTHEYEQSVENAKQREEAVKEETDRIKNETMTTIRQQAEAKVAQDDQVRAEQQAQAEEIQRQKEEEQAKKQAEEDERTGKTWEKNRDEIIEKILDNEYLEEGERREARRKDLTERANMIRQGRIDMAGMANTTEGLLAVGMLGRNLGVDVIYTDDTNILPNNAAGKYENGVVYLNKKLIQEGKMTTGQAVIEVALHEYTHYLENTKQYGKYSQTVLDFLFQGDEARLQAAIDSKIEDYKEKFGQDLTEEKAKAEIVADFAKNRLNDRDVVQRFISNGLAGKIRNALHNINQAIKNYRLTGTERETAEYLRKTERLYQKMIEDAARSATHPDGGQFSIAQLASAAGLDFDQNTLEMRTPDGKLITGTGKSRLTPEMLNNTPVGMLIGLAENGLKNKKGKSILDPTITKETADAQRKMFADLANMAAQYKDSDLVWEVASSMLFSAMKSNSDPQYSTTIDFGTICAKTQEIINVMSQVMLEQKRGLTRDEVLKVYNGTSKAGLTVPCPVCYVFSRWMGVPSLLGQMSQYQKRFVKTNADGSINVAETQKAANDYIKAALDKYGDKETIDKTKTSLQNRIKTQEKNRTEALKVLSSETATAEEKAKAQTKHDKAIETMDSLTKELGEVEAYNWVTQALCKQVRKGKKTINVLDQNGNYVVDSDFELTPDEVLFDLRRTGDFAKYTKNWSYRNTRGAGMGKAIMPYSGMSIGDVVYGTTRKMASANPFLTMDPETAAKGVSDAIARAVKQNLIGGQRLQSTSDFRPEWGLDYMMTFLELQAIGSKVQMYTKVAEAVPLLASMGGDINLSIMGKGQGWHIDENGNYVLDFSDVTGMNYETAKGLKDQYDNVQMILVGMNDTHIRLALADSDIDFVIPWHASGNSKDTLASLVSSASVGKEQLETSSDYTDTQSDKASDNQTEDQKKLWNLRMKILQGKKINAQEREIIYQDKEYLAPLYERFNVEGKDPDCYKVKLGQDQAKQIFPYEYWDKTLTKDNADENGKRFIEYCQHFGITPRFSGTVKHNEDGTFEVTGNFAGAVYDDDGNIVRYDPKQMYKGYWKTLIDRPMYDNNGNYRDQQVVDVTKARIGELKSGKLTGSDMPLSTSAMYGPKYTEQEKNAVDNSLAAINYQSDMRAGQYSDGGVGLTDVEELFSEQNVPYTKNDRVGKYNDSVSYVSKVFSDWNDGSQRSAKEVIDSFDKEKYPTLYQWLHNTYEKGDKSGVPVLLSDITDFFDYDKEQVSKGAESIELGWRALAEEYPNGLPVTEISGTDSTNGNYGSRIESINRLLFDGGKSAVYKNEDTGAYIVIDDDTISESFAYNKSLKNRGVPNKVLEQVLRNAKGLLENGVYVGSHINYADPRGNVHYIAAPIEIDGYTDAVVFAVHDKTDSKQNYGERAYVTEVMVIENKNAPSSLRTSPVNGEAVSGVTPSGISNISIGKLLNSVNSDRIRFFDKESLSGREMKGSFSDGGASLTELDTDIVEAVDNVYDDMSLDELAELLGLDNDTSDEEVRQVVTVAVNDIKNEFDPTIYNGRLYVNPETMDHWLSGSGFASTNPNYAQAYIAMMNPADFLRITTVSEQGQRRILNETNTLDSERLTENAKRQPIQLSIDEESGRIVGHEGRHRAVALARAGVKEIPVLLFDNSTKYSKTPKASMRLDGQNYGDSINGNTITFTDVLPLSGQYRGEIVNRFTASDEEKQEANQNRQRILQYSDGGASLTELDQGLVDNGVITQEDLDAYRNNVAGRPLEGNNTLATSAAGPAQRAFGEGMLQDSNEVSQRVKDIVLMQNGRGVDTNADQLDRAIKWIRSNKQTPNSDGLYESIQQITSNRFDYRTADGQARMVATMAMAVAKQDTMAQVALADAFNRQGTDLGRALQARKLFRMMTPEGRISTIQKMLDEQQNILNAKGMKVDLKFSDWVYMAAAAANNEADMEKVQQVAAKELADQLPISWKDRLRGWRMLSMLGNPRTHIRNVIGNALFVPAVSIKNKLSAVAELGMKEGNRTKTLAPVVNRTIREFARQDAVAMKDVLTGEAKYNENNRVQQQQRSFNSKVLQALSDFNSNWLEREDWFFLKGHYIRALGGWMQANGYTAADMRANPSLLEQGRAYAIEEAQKATYRDFNQLAATLNQVSRKGGVAGFLVDATLPFKKTPANILRRGIEYSPVGIAKTLAADAYHLKQYLDYQKGKLNALPEKAITPNQFIDKICAGLTGTAIMAVGALLGSAGVVSVGLDDDDDKFEKEQGGQEYAIRFNLLGQDVTFTMDWAAPMSMPFFVGAAVYEQIANGGDVDIESLINAMAAISEPVFNLSMMDGINTLFKTSQYNTEETNPITQIGAKIGSNYLTSFVPSVLGATARTIDPVRRKAFVESGKGNGVMGTFRYAWEQTENKIPGVSQSNIPYRDIWGNAEESPLWERIAENFVLPGYISEYKDDPILNEMERLYGLTEEKGLIPSDPAKSFTYKKEKYVLTAEQWDAYKVARGQAAHDTLEALMATENYQKAGPEEQAQLIVNAWSYADAVGKAAVVPGYEVTGYGKDPVTTISQNGAKTYYKSELLKALKAEDMDTFDTCVEALKENGMEDSAIKTAIADSGYRDEYKAAYRRGDDMRMLEIEETLDSTGYDYDFAKWRKDEQKKMDEE